MKPIQKPSLRKPMGILAILLLITIWCVAIASLSPFMGDQHWVVQLIFYAIAGVGWITPLRPLLRWMESSTVRRSP